MNLPLVQSKGRRGPKVWQMILRRRKVILAMAVGGALVGLAVAQTVPRVYYSRTLVEIAQVEGRPNCNLFMGPELTFSERLGARFDAAAESMGWPNLNFKKRLSFPKNNDFHGSDCRRRASRND